MTGRRPPPASGKVAQAAKKRGAASCAEVPAGKRVRVREKATFREQARKAPSAEQQDMCKVLHQVGYVEGAGFYDSKPERLQQLFDRLPATSGPVVVFAEPSSMAAVKAAVERCRRRDAAREARAMALAPRKVATPCCTSSAVASSAKTEVQESSREVSIVMPGSAAAPKAAEFVINYDIPSSAKDYLRRLGPLLQSATRSGAKDRSLQSPRVAYSFIEECQLRTRRYQEIRSLFSRAQRAALENSALGGAGKAAEFAAVLEQMEPDELGEEEEADQSGDADEEQEEEDSCDCSHCMGCAVACVSFHTPMMSLRRGRAQAPGVEVVRLHLRALEDFSSAAPLIAPRLPGHVGTVICLHCMNVHNPWDGWEHLFAVPDAGGSLRVVFLLADECSWHDYPDVGTLGAGGVPWMDILDVDAMERSDKLLERLVDHEAELLGGHSQRVVLMGMSQGGGQSMLRFIRSRRRLGGWMGSVCHAPTAPHTSRDRDPLLVPGRSLANCDRPMRLLAGEEDSVFPPGLVVRDVDRLRSVGGFQDVKVEVRQGMGHAGAKEMPAGAGAKGAKAAVLRRAQQEVPELLHMRRYLPMMLGATVEAS